MPDPFGSLQVRLLTNRFINEFERTSSSKTSDSHIVDIDQWTKGQQTTYIKF